MRVERRFTIDQIAERLALPRTTIYYWVRDLPIASSGPGGVFPEPARRKGTRAMQRKYRHLREVAYQEGLASFDELAADPTFRDFVCLYVAEGYQRNRNAVEICNSDPAVMRVAHKLLRKSNSNQLTGRVWRSRHGVLSIRVQDTLFRSRLEAWMSRLRESWL